MEIIKAGAEHLPAVKHITRETISAVYPRYYPAGAVEFFLRYHSDEKIADDIENGRTYLCIDDKGNAAGTVSVKENDIGRLFVLPEFQGSGFGRCLLDFAEKLVSRSYDVIELDASLSAKAIYLSRGYKECGYNDVQTDNGDHLCWDIMSKKVR